MHPIRLITTAALFVFAGQGLATAQDPGAGLSDPGGPGQAKAWAHVDPSLAWEPCADFLPEGCVSTVLNGDPAGDNADVFLKLPAGTSIPRHRHTAAERMTLVAGRLRVTYDGGDPVELTPGMYGYSPAGLPHDGECAPGADCVLFIAFDGPVDAIEVAPVGADGGH